MFEKLYQINKYEGQPEDEMMRNIIYSFISPAYLIYSFSQFPWPEELLSIILKLNTFAYFPLQLLRLHSPPSAYIDIVTQRQHTDNVLRFLHLPFISTGSKRRGHRRRELSIINIDLFNREKTTRTVSCTLNIPLVSSLDRRRRYKTQKHLLPNCHVLLHSGSGGVGVGGVLHNNLLLCFAVEQHKRCLRVKSFVCK